MSDEFDTEWEVLETQRNSGWVEWTGGECPIEQGVRVEIRFRDGEVITVVNHGFRWDHNGLGGDIVAYREVSDD